MMNDALRENDEVELQIRQFEERRRQRHKNWSARDYLQLMRLPNAFTAMADVAMGFLFVQPAIMAWTGERWRPSGWDIATLVTLIVSSGLLYTAGVVLNDVFDLELDRRERPERPIPSGRIAADAARRLGFRLLVSGVALATATVLLVGQFKPGTVAALLATVILLYDAWLKRTPAGPLAMGACRMLNVMLGMNACDAPLHGGDWLVAGAIGIYVAGVTWFARREAQRSDRLHLAMATAVMGVALAMIAWLPSVSSRVMPAIQKHPGLWYLLVGGLGVLIIRRCVMAVIEPIPRRVRAAVTQCILSIVMLDAVACYSVHGIYWASGILLFLAPAIFLNRWIEAT